MDFPNDQDLENILPDGNPKTIGVFSGNQNMNLDKLNTYSSTEPPPRMTRRQVAIIDAPKLRYRGEKFREFLDEFEMAAEYFGAEGYDKIRQICRFVGPEDLKLELEYMDGYKERDWTVLRCNMVSTWGDFHSQMQRLQFTIWDLYDLVDKTANTGGPKGLDEFKNFK